MAEAEPKTAFFQQKFEIRLLLPYNNLYKVDLPVPHIETDDRKKLPESKMSDFSIKCAKIEYIYHKTGVFMSRTGRKVIKGLIIFILPAVFT